MINRRYLILAGTAVLAGAGVVAYAPWEESSASEAVFTGKTDGIAINGYDPVGYFKQNAPVKGSPDHTSQYKGATWHFASAENRDLFAADPEKYAPKYGGYCAYAAAGGYIAKTEPDAFTIVDGKLYLNYDLNVRSLWEQDKSSYISKADTNWPELEPK